MYISLISKEWRYHFCLSDWRSLYCVSDFLATSSSTLLHGFTFPIYKLFLNSTALSQVLIFPIFEWREKSYFPWDDLCESDLSTFTASLLISHAPSLLSFLYLRVTVPSSWMMYGTRLLSSPYFSGQTFLSLLQSFFIPAFPKCYCLFLMVL